MIYMENVYGINKYAYQKRNPVQAKNHQGKMKGKNDIKRIKILCKNVSSNVKYKNTVILLKQ